MNTCILCGGPFEGFIVGFTTDGKPHHEDPRDCIAWTESATVQRCIEIAASFERGYTRIPAMLIQRAIRSRFEPDVPGYSFFGPKEEVDDPHVPVPVLAERMRQQNAYEWWQAMEGK